MRKYVPAIMKRTEAAATDFALSVNSACSELQHLPLKESSEEDIKNVYPPRLLPFSNGTAVAQSLSFDRRPFP
ncbi:hypothetical protein DSM110093_03891 (plasmid) [Sulfitobacter sp. DSM 110093]|nr:hypothetical protein DSM110093_03630 [Sulfitobacter sp. DSM 110093]UOA34056.1 hypothetical protein DSM110093_03891 [Sulfitobacter sp. DSM 110093]